MTQSPTQQASGATPKSPSPQATDGGPAFPVLVGEDNQGAQTGAAQWFHTGLTLHDYFAAAALSNPNLCTGRADEYQLIAWFGRA